MIEVFIIAALSMLALYSLAEQKFVLQAIIISIMYLFYGFLWYDRFFEATDADANYAGNVMIIGTVFSAPFYILYHLVVILYSRKPGLKKMLHLNLAGLVICIIHLVCVFC